MVYHTLNYWVLGILKTRKHDVLETGTALNLTWVVQ
jgi:hypothetical protein